MSFVLKNFSYQYADTDKKVLNNINFEIIENEVTAIVGPSGCGKSTLVNILSKVIPDIISTGELSGEVIAKDAINFAVVSQSPENQLFGYGVEDAIVFGMENMAVPSEQIKENLEYVLNLLNIQHLRRRSVSTLSGGQRQAVCIASILAMSPNVVIMDEPVSSLDPDGKKLIQSTLKQLNAAGQTTIIVDNNINWFAEIVDHVIGLYDGKVVFDGTKTEFFNDFEMQDMLGVTLPEEVLIYRLLKSKIKDINFFYNYDGAIEELLNYTVDSNKIKITNDIYDGDDILTAEGIYKTFSDNFHALIDIDINFKQGRITSVIGQNGSGKTTLVKHLNGLLRPERGSIKYKGSITKDKSVAEISKDIILVFQHPEHMLFNESVYNELTFCADAQGTPYEEKDVEKVLTEYNLIEDKETLPVNLPMGKKHILTILSVLFSTAEVIILDEPTLGMDSIQKVWLEKIIRSLKDNGKTVIMISHEMPLVFKLSDNLVLLNDGKKIFEGTKKQLLNSEKLFEETNIPLPSVVKLAKYFNLDADVYTVECFAKEFIKKYNSSKGES